LRGEKHKKRKLKKRKGELETDRKGKQVRTAQPNVIQILFALTSN
jgi:hypothetical protein